MRRYFIAGTDTDCGKTYVTCQLLNYFSRSAAIKPLASGCVERDGHWHNSDALCLQQYGGLSLETINPWRFKSAIAPHLAAEEEGATIFAQELVNYCVNLKLDHVETLFIEGAGGLMVPLNSHETWLDFLIQSQVPVILVVGMKLGCINHALLTEQVLKANRISCVGWIANCVQPGMRALDKNIETLKNRLQMPLLTIVQHNQAITNFSYF